MLVRVALFMLWLTIISISTPLHKSRHHRLQTRCSPSLSSLDRQVALTAQAAMRQKFQNAPAILAGLGTVPGYAIPSSLQNAYNRASDFATNISLLDSLLKSSPPQPYSPSAVRVAVASSITNKGNFTIDPLQDQTDGVNDFEYYGPMTFGSQAEPLLIDFDTGSAGKPSTLLSKRPRPLVGTDLWVTVDCDDCGELSSFKANASSTYRNTSQPFHVAYGSGEVSGMLAQDTVSLGPLQAHNQSIGAVRSVSQNFANSPNDGLAGLAFSTIASSRQPTVFENLIPQLAAPLFSFYLTRNKVGGSEIYLGGIDVSKASKENISWVPVVSKTYWTVGMTAASVNDVLIETGNINAIVDTGTSFIYGPSHFVDAIYKQIPGSAPAFDFGQGFYAYNCSATIKVSFKLGPYMLPLDPRDFNLGWHPADPTGQTCVGAVVDGGPTFQFAILGDSFLKGYVTVFDYAHGARVGFVKSVNEEP
ncbi:Aspartic peptidase domain containing protein [Tylopilus felleus]